MMKPQISVIIPLYNKESIVERSVNSVLCQSFTDFELIIVDDGSTDNSLSVVKSIKDSRIHIIEQENGGPSKARNTGVKHSKGEWILFLDADDELLEGALERLLSLTSIHHNANIIDGSFVVKSPVSEQSETFDDKVIKDNYKAFFYRETLPSTGHTLFKSKLLKVFPYDTTLRRYEDVELIMRILKDATIVTTSKPIFRVNAEFSCASSARSNIEEDFLGHLDFRGKSFWEMMCLYQFYLSERPHYKGQVEKLYPRLKYRYDLLLLYKFLRLFK